MSILKLIAALVIMAASIGLLVLDYSNINTFEKVGLLGTVVAGLTVLLDHHGSYRKGKLLKTEIEDNVSRITGSLIDNEGEFEQNGVSERSLARAINISTEQAVTAIDRLESREASSGISLPSRICRAS